LTITSRGESDADIETWSWHICHHWRRYVAFTWSLFWVWVYILFHCLVERIFLLFY